MEHGELIKLHELNNQPKGSEVYVVNNECIGEQINDFIQRNILCPDLVRVAEMYYDYFWTTMEYTYTGWWHNNPVRWEFDPIHVSERKFDWLDNRPALINSVVSNNKAVK